MKRLIFIFVLFAAFQLVVDAQDDMERFASLLKGKRMQLDYSFTARNAKGKQFSGSGTVTYQDGAYRLDTDVLQIYNDGKTMWTINDIAKEVVIEKGMKVDLTAHPEMIISLCGQNPKNAEISMTCSQDGEPSGISLRFKNGMTATVQITGASFDPAGDPADFAFKTSKENVSYVVTDLR